MLNFRQLRYFVGIVDAGSFSKAATEMNVAQSALSHHIKQMEDKFGIELLTRERTGIRVTDCGEKLLHHARIILHQGILAETELSNNKLLPSGDVVVGVPPGIARIMVSQLLATACDVIPDIKIKIIEGTTGQLEEWMDNATLNLAVLYRPHSNIADCTDLLIEEFCLVAKPDMPPFSETIKFSELSPFALALTISGSISKNYILNAAAQSNLKIDVRFEMDSLPTIIKMVTEGTAYSILPPSALQGEVKSNLVKLIKIVDPEITRPIILLCNPNCRGNLAVTLVNKLIIEVVSRLVESGEWPVSGS